MISRPLGLTGLRVSPLCFGTLILGPLHKNYPQTVAAELMCQACDLGVNFFDTAEIYGTYRLLQPVIRRYPEVIIAGKSYAVTGEEMRRSLELARKEINRDYVDIFCLHEVENAAALRGHRGALDFLGEAKAKGIIKAVGISSHTIAGVRAGATEPAIDVIHPLINHKGIGIKDGTVEEMVAALQTAGEFGKGIYAMKVLAGGHLAGEARLAIRFIQDLHCVDSIAIGMQSLQEIRFNLSVINGEPVSTELEAEVAGIGRSLSIASWCQACGRCITACEFGALSLARGKLRVEPEKCVRCGYCARVCPEFCLKIV
jgi:predicted aldo/keto reductase-like oxidoreductase